MGFSHAFFVEQMSRALQIFKRKLTNLSSANPTLWMRRLKADIHLDLTETENALGFSAWQLMSDLLGGKKRVSLIPVVDSRNADANLLSQKLHTLARRQQLVLQERGVDQLFLAFGFVMGCWPDGSWVRTPLVYFPCTLGHNQKSWSLTLDSGEGFINPSFLLAYAFHFKQDIESSLFEKELEIEVGDGLSFLTALYKLLKESNLEIHFNQELFQQKVQPFSSITKETIPSGYQAGMLKLQPNSVLGLFPQSDSVLVSDFEYLEQYQIDLESIFQRQPSINQTILEKNLLCPLPVDGSQEACIRRVKQGQSLVVQGPPGTGKSQLISNVMADAMASGKSVLLVCQKRVALDVVLARLKEVGVGKFVGLWADFKKDRELIYNQLASQIEGLEDAEMANNKLDTVVLDRQFAFAAQTIEQICQNLEEWKAALYDFQLAGISIKELYSRTIKFKLVHFEEKPLVSLKWDEWEVFSIWLSKHWPSIVATLHPDFQFNGRKNWATLSDSEFDTIPSLWTDLAAQSERLKGSFLSKQRTNRSDRWETDLHALTDTNSKIQIGSDRLKAIGLEFLFRMLPNQWISKNEWQSLVDDVGSIERIQHQLVNWPVDLELNISEIDDYLHSIAVWKKHARIGVWWHFLTFINKEVRELKIVAQKMRINFRTIHSLEEHLSLAKKFIQLSASGFSQRIEAISVQRLQEVKNLVENFRMENEAIETLQNHLINVNEIVPGLGSWPQFEEMSRWATSLNATATEIKGKWNSYFHHTPKVQLPAHFPELRIWVNVFTNTKTQIRAADNGRLNIPESWEQILIQILSNQKFRSLPKGELLQLLTDFWTQAWVKRIESHYPVLQQVTEESWEEDLQLLRQKISEKENLVGEILRQRLKEKTYKDLDHNRLRNRITYRDLYHQVTKKRQRWPMRQLWEQSGEEILKLIPAWLATPESVSATWPMEMRFDLVIFDEASQCFAEKGLPAAFRGRQLLVIGDDKQLAPNHLFTSRWDEEDYEEATFSEQESLLDLAKQFLPQAMLRSHYRSLYPELIEFSNQHFYHNKLESIPLPKVYWNRVPALTYEKVDGIWKNQQNEIEAEHLCLMLLKRLQSNENESFGVITFNQKQQALIEKMLDQLADRAGMVLPESLFIKNIENVQGDERDHILFSIAYARNEQGKVISQFGSLSQSGGENRLNVAVSRAKMSLTVVASIFPGELNVLESASNGPLLLKKYLEFVHGGLPFKEPRFGVQPKSATLNTPFADSAEFGSDGLINLQFKDGERMNSAPSMKDYFGYKYLMLKKKEYNVTYFFSRKTWLEKIESLHG